MKYLLLQIIFFSIIFSSCKKENEAYFDKSNGLTTIHIDSIKYSYISEDYNYFYKGLFSSKSDIQKFNLVLKKDRKYRLSSSQPFINFSTINLTLLAGNDTITVSQNLNGQQVLYFNSSKDQTLILQAQLQNKYNLSLDYNLYFEELNYPSINIENKTFSYYGHFSNDNTDTCYFYPSNSYWYKWMKLDQELSNTSKIDFNIISSDENKNQDLGFIIGGTNELSAGNNYANNLPNGVFFSIKNKQYTITQIEDSYSNIIETGTLQSTLDFNQTINFRIETDSSYSNKKNIFINNELTAKIDIPILDKFYAVFSDRILLPIKIYNLNISN